MKTYVSKFFKFLEVEMNASSHTIINYKNDLKQSIEFFQKENCEDIFSITYQLIRKFLAYLKEKEYKKTSIARKLATLKSFFNFLLREGYIKTNPAKYVITPKQEKKLPNFLDIDEIFNLLDHIEKDKILGIRNNAILETLYSTGIRVSELVFLDLDNIDFIGGLIKVFGKGKKQRIVPIGEKALNSIKKYLLKRNELAKKKKCKKRHYFLIKMGED
ncbi:MAG: site-specific integrase [bacterium]